MMVRTIRAIAKGKHVSTLKHPRNSAHEGSQQGRPPIDNLIMKDFPCLVVDLLLSTTYL